MTVPNPALNPISYNEIQLSPAEERPPVVVSLVVLPVDVTRNSLLAHSAELDSFSFHRKPPEHGEELLTTRVRFGLEFQIYRPEFTVLQAECRCAEYTELT